MVNDEFKDAIEKVDEEHISPELATAKMLSFQDAYKQWLEDEAGRFEPEQFQCECGSRRFQGEDSMEIDFTYCDGLYQYILKRTGTSRIKLDGSWQERAVNFNLPILFVSGHCPVPLHQKAQVSAKRVSHEYQTLDGRPMTFDSFDNSCFPSAFEAAQQYATTGSLDGKKKLWIVGEPGVGKTHLARGVHVRLMQEMRESIFISSVKLADHFRAVQSNAEDWQAKAKGNDWLARAFKSDYVLIDDLGSERLPNDGSLFKEQFKAFLEEFRGGLVITTNLSSEALKDRYEDKIYERLLMNSEVILMHGESYRKRSFPKTAR